MLEKLTQTPQETTNQIAVTENIQPSTRKSIVDMLNTRIELPKIQIPDKLKQRAKGVALTIGTLAASGALMLGNPEKTFAMTPLEAKEGIENNTVVDARFIGSDAQIELQKINNKGSKIEIEISGNVQKGLGPLIPRDMLPESVTKLITTPPSKTTESVTPNSPEVAPKPSTPSTPKNENPLNAVIGLGVLGLAGTRGLRELKNKKWNEPRAKNPSSKIEGKTPEGNLTLLLEDIRAKEFPAGRPSLEVWINRITKVTNGEFMVDPLDVTKKLILGKWGNPEDKARYCYDHWNENWNLTEVTLPTVEFYENLLLNNTAGFDNQKIFDAGETIYANFGSLANDGLSRKFQTVPLKPDGTRDLVEIRRKIGTSFGTDTQVISIGIIMLDNIISNKL